MRKFFVAAALTLGIAATATADAPRSPYGLGAANPIACAPGYHQDAGGNCQPNIAQQNRYCPNGLVFHPTFDGWTCDPPPPQAY